MAAKKRKKKQRFREFYEEELLRLQFELVKLHHWIIAKDLRVLILFEGRDAAGKGGIIKRMVAPLIPRHVRLVALGKPTETERTQWYFQRYIAHLPAGGEIVICDRSWYNRAGVERVMGFCTDQQYWEFLRSTPEFERMLIRSGIILVKYYLSISSAEQENRFQSRAKDPTRRWKLTDMDIEARNRWVDYSIAKDIMLEHTDIPEARWYQIPADSKRRARLNCIRHLLSLVPYENIIPPTIELPPRSKQEEFYERPPMEKHIVLSDSYADR